MSVVERNEVIERNYTLPKGETWDIVLAYKNDDGSYIDWNDYTVRMQIREDWDGDLIHEMGVDNIVVQADPTQLLVTLSDEQTAAFNDEMGVYDIEMQDSLGRVKKLLRGQMFFLPEATR